MDTDELARSELRAKFAALLRELRQSRGMSLRDLANASADGERRSHGKIHRTLLTASQESEFLAALDAGDIDSEPVGGVIERLAVSYLNTPPAPMLAQASQLRSTIVKALKSHGRPASLDGPLVHDARALVPRRQKPQASAIVRHGP
jgi:transcriptional regulator with XRE-family HTH domain